MVDALIALAARLGSWGYLVVFAAAALEASAFLGLIVPGETVVIACGFLASQGVLDVGDVIVVAILGAILGDSIGYEIGRHLGRPWLLRHGRWIALTPRRLQRVDAFFERHGGKAVLLGRFVGIVRALAPFVAGSSRMPYRRFLLYNAAGAIVWAPAAVLLGYWLGEGWRLAERWLGRVGAIGVAVAIVVVVLAWWRRRRRQASAV